MIREHSSYHPRKGEHHAKQEAFSPAPNAGDAFVRTTPFVELDCADAAAKAVTQALVEVHDRIVGERDRSREKRARLERENPGFTYSMEHGYAVGLETAAAMVRAMMEGK